MGLFKKEECAVCGEKCRGFNYKDDYNLGMRVRRRMPLRSEVFVCTECAREALDLTCSKCKESFGNSLDSETLESLIKKRKEVENCAGKRHQSHILERLSMWDFVCEKCLDELSRGSLADVVDIPERDIPDEPINLFSKRASKNACGRCGRDVSEDDNYAYSLRSIYGKDASEEAKKVLPAIEGFLKSKYICSSCLYHLSPRQARKDLDRRIGPDWCGTSNTDDLHGAEIVRRFPVLKHKTGIEMFKDTPWESEVKTAIKEGKVFTSLEGLRNSFERESVRLGGNGLVNFKWECHKARTDRGECGLTYRHDENSAWLGTMRGFQYFTGSAVPVLAKRTKVVCAVHTTKPTAPRPKDGVRTGRDQVKLMIIDGSNLLRRKGGNWLQGLNAAQHALTEKRIPWFVCFDANVFHVLEKQGHPGDSKLLHGMVESDSDHYQVVPAGIRADDFILQQANRECAHILSNDLFRDFAEKYPWLKGNQRVHRFDFVRGRLLVPDFDIAEELGQGSVQKQQDEHEESAGKNAAKSSSRRKSAKMAKVPKSTRGGKKAASKTKSETKKVASKAKIVKKKVAAKTKPEKSKDTTKAKSGKKTAGLKPKGKKKPSAVGGAKKSRVATKKPKKQSKR